MATQTTNYGLKKPAYTDAADISVINENMDTIDAKMKEIEDKAGSGGGVSSGVSYSTEEQVVGTWIDGKPLYQKTVIGSFTNNCSLIYIGKVAVKSITGVINVTSGGSITIGFSFNRTDSLYSGADYDFTTGNVEVFAKGWDISECIVTVLYTKTTD